MPAVPRERSSWMSMMMSSNSNSSKIDVKEDSDVKKEVWYDQLCAESSIIPDFIVRTTLI